MNKREQIALNYRDYLDKLGCSFRTMEEYDRMLRLSFNSYLDEYPNYVNFYDCTDPSLVSKIFDRMNADPHYKDLNDKWKFVPENAFRHYISFLYVANNFNWKNNSTIEFYKYLLEEKHISVTSAGKFIDILKNRKQAKHVLKLHNIEGSVQILSLVIGIVSDIVDSYEGENKDLAIQGCKLLLDFGKSVLTGNDQTIQHPKELCYIKKDIESIVSKQNISNMSFSVIIDGCGSVSIAV